VLAKTLALLIIYSVSPTNTEVCAYVQCRLLQMLSMGLGRIYVIINIAVLMYVKFEPLYMLQ